MAPAPHPGDEAPPSMQKGAKLIVVDHGYIPPQLIDASWIFPLIGITLALGWIGLRLGARRLRRR